MEKVEKKGAVFGEEEGAVPSEAIENGVSNSLIHPAVADAELSDGDKIKTEKFPRVKAVRTFVFDERMLKEQMSRYGYKDLESFIQKEIKENFTVNVMLERLAVYRDNITLEVEVTEDE